MSSDNSERILAGLIDVCEAGARGFERCAARVPRPELKRFFEIRANGCRDAAQTLAALIGGATAPAPIDRSASKDGAGPGAGWPVVPQDAPDDELSVLEECEQGEDLALQRYEQALQAGLPEPARGVVVSQYEGARRNHDQVRALRDRALADREAGRA